MASLMLLCSFMEILNKNSTFPKNVSLILGFFDGIHIGHQEVIKSALGEYQTVLVTFKKSPAEFFGKNVKYIYPRGFSYECVKQLGVDYILEFDFAELANLDADTYLKNLVDWFSPVKIFTGYNHTFGKNKLGNPKFLEKNQNKYGYEFFCVQECKKNEKTVSSTLIKELLQEGAVEKANNLLGRNFSIVSKVVDGAKLGRELGYPTANMHYPEDIIKLPYGVYCVKVFNKPAILNWGIKPTVSGENEIIEVHILNFTRDLYGKGLEIEFIKKIRDEKKFNNLDALKFQINEDIKQCSELL